MIKSLKKAGIEGSACNIIMAMYDKPITIIVNGENRNAVLLKSRMRQRCALSLLF
jgi:hypothetical protein